MQGHIRRRGKRIRSWELKYDLGPDPITHERRIQYESYRGLKTGAEEKLRERLSALDTGTFVERNKVTVAAYLAEWLKNTAPAKANLKTLERYEEHIRNHIVPWLGSIPLQGLTAEHLESFYEELLNSGRKDGKGGLAPLTVRHVHAVITKALSGAEKKNRVARNVARLVDNLPKVEPVEVVVLEEAELAQLFRASESSRYYVAILLAAGTGLRRGEVFALRFKDIDLTKGKLQVVQALEQTKQGLRVKPPKTKRSKRTLSLPTIVVEELRRQRITRVEEALSQGSAVQDGDLVFTQGDGSPVNLRAFSKEFARIVQRAGVSRITFHGLRHSHATLLLKQGTHPKVVADRLGHTSVSTTLDIYSHVVPRLQEDIAVSVDGVLRTALER